MLHAEPAPLGLPATSFTCVVLLGYLQAYDFYGKTKRRTVPRPGPEHPDNDILDRDEALEPDLTEAQSNRKASGEARAARDRDKTYYGRKCKLAHHTDHLPPALWDAFLADAALPRVKACSERAVIGSLLLGFLVRGLFTIHVADPLGLHGQPVYTDIPVSQAAIPDLSCRNLCRGLPGDGANIRPNAAVAAVLAAHPDLRTRLAAIPRYHPDTNMVDHVGQQLQTAFGNIPTLPFAGRLKKSVSLAGAKAEVALQRGLLGLEEGERIDNDWLEEPANRGGLLRHAVHTTREMEAAMAAWQLDMVPWQQPELICCQGPPGTPYALTPTSKCQARHAFIDTKGLYGLMRDASMLGVLTEEGVTSLKKFRNGALPDPAEPGKYIEGPKDSQVKPQLRALSQISSKPSSLASYRQFADTVLATYDTLWVEVSKPRWANAKFRVYCGKQRVVARFWSK
ncbi:hypothetical protein QJQ45_008109, partial [Haematococcus lacustris]